MLPPATTLRTLAAVCLAPISTSGTPLPGRLDAPQNQRPFTVGCWWPGRSSDSWFRPWDSPKTAPLRRLYLRISWVWEEGWDPRAARVRRWHAAQKEEEVSVHVNGGRHQRGSIVGGNGCIGSRGALFGQGNNIENDNDYAWPKIQP